MIFHKFQISLSVLLIGTIFFSCLLNRGVPQGAFLVFVPFCGTLIYTHGCYYFLFVDVAQYSTLTLHGTLIFNCLWG